MKKISIQQIAMLVMGIVTTGLLNFTRIFPENVSETILLVGIAIVSVMTMGFILLIHTLQNR